MCIWGSGRLRLKIWDLNHFSLNKVSAELFEASEMNSSYNSFSMDLSSHNDAETLKIQELAEKKKRRLERNRASARQCRKRKKEKKLLLRQQLAHLEADNLQLRLKLQVGEDNKDASGDDQSVFITNKLNEMIKEGATESEIQRAIQELKERFSDYGRDRRSAIDFHIAQLKRCLQPTMTTRAILWLMSLAPKYQDPVTGESLIGTPTDELSALYQSLLDEVHPDPAQRRLMVSYTAPRDSELDHFVAINNTTAACNGMLERIVDIVCNKNDSLDQEMANVQSTLTPRQIAKFILWIDKNPVCIQMLEALWPHLTYSNKRGSGENLSSGGDGDGDGDGDDVGDDGDDFDDDSSGSSDND
eukprot:gene35653-43242_t